MVVQRALADASEDIAATNTYDYRHLATYRTTALAATTGTFTRTLAQTIDGLIAVNAPKLHASQVAKVNRIGISNLHGEDGTALVFGQLLVRNTSYPSGRTDPFEAVVGIRRVQQQWLITRLVTGGTAACDPPGTAALATACIKAGFGAAAITTYRRSSFDRDFAQAESMVTGQLLAELRSQKRATLHTMLKGRFDMRSDVVASAVETATPDQVEVLVALSGFRSGNKTPTPEHLAVTMRKIAGRWLLSDVTDVGVS